MELPVKIIVIVAVIVAVLVVLGMLFLQSSGQSLSRADAERIFAGGCLAYAQRGCAWDVTYDADFSNYLRACKVLYGQQREAFSCLYSLCDRCFETNDIRCSGLCNICSGNEYASVDRRDCCAKYAGECAGSTVSCGAC